MKGLEFEPQQFREITPDQYKAAERFRVPAAQLDVWLREGHKPELLLLKKLPPIRRNSVATQDLIRILDLRDLDSGKKEATFSRVDPRGDKWNPSPEQLTLSYTSLIIETPERPDKVEDWEGWPQIPRPVGYLLPRDFSIE